MDVEDCHEQDNVFPNSAIDTSNVKLQKLKNANDLPVNHDEMKGTDCISDAKSKFKDIKKEKHPDTAKSRNSLSSLYKINSLDESSDFIECDLQKKIKSGKQKPESVLCEICREDITPLNIKNREIHVNNCIDKQISCSSTESAQTNETENVFILECPLCFKSFSTPEVRSNHIKKCGKSKGLNTQSIIKALELQERHTLERISLGLPAKPIKVPKMPKNPTAKRTVTEPKNKSDSDFQLAKALSLSLASSSQTEVTENNENVNMTVLKPPAANQRPGKKCKATLNTPLLVLRSEEDRKRLLLQKVEAILTAGSKSELDSSNQIVNDKSSEKQEDIQKEIPTLWNLACTAAEKGDYYVDLLFDWIKPSDHEVGDKHFHLSQIPGHEIVTQLPCDYTFSTPEEKNTYVLPSANSSTTDSCCSVTECLSSLVASSWMSDVDIHTACGTIIPAHKLLLALRCPPLKQDLQFCSEKGRATLKWGTVSFDSALQFLNYIYTGNIKINDNYTSDLLYLANKYEVHDLLNIICTNKKTSSETFELNLSKNDAKDNMMFTNEKAISKTDEVINLNKNDVTDNVNLCHIISSSPELQEAEEIDDENEDDVNTDLEIVYSCINSSFKPSQSFSYKTDDTTNIPPVQFTEVSTINKNYSILRTDNVCDKDINVSLKYDATNFISDRDNCTSPVIFDCENVASNSDDNEEIEYLEITSPEEIKNSCPTSPVTFKSENVIENFNDNEVIKLPVQTSSETGESPSHAEELNICIIESNDSNDSVEFLQSSYSSCKKLDHSILNNEDVTLPLLKADFKSITLKDLPESDLKTNISPKSESVKLSPFSKIYSQNSFNVSTKPESPELYSKMSHSSFQYQNNSINATIKDLREKGLSNEDLNFSIENFVSEEITPREKNRISDLIESKKASSEKKLNNSPSQEFRSECKKKLFPCSSPLKSITQIETKFYETAEDISLRNCDSPEILAYECDNSYEKIESNILGKTSALYDFNSKCSKKEEFNFSPVASSIPNSPIALAVKSSLNNPIIESHDLSRNESTSLSSKDDLKLKPGCSENSDIKKIAETVTTPHVKDPQFKISHSPITPFPDYKSMMTPEIKAALKRIGVKALPRKKAVAVLSHVYNETHPMVADEMDTDALQAAIKTPEKSKGNDPKKRKKLTDDHQKQPKKRQKENHQEGIGESPESDDSKPDNPKWLECVPEISFTQSTQDSPTKSTTEDIESVKEYILSNAELYDNILSYKPLNLVEFHQELKSSNIKLSLQKLMDFLDEQCITFTLPRKEEYKKKQTARAQNFRKRMIAKLSQQTT